MLSRASSLPAADRRCVIKLQARCTSGVQSKQLWRVQEVMLLLFQIPKTYFVADLKKLRSYTIAIRTATVAKTSKTCPSGGLQAVSPVLTYQGRFSFPVYTHASKRRSSFSTSK